MCERLSDLLGRADGGELGEAELRELRVHLETCAPLAARLMRERCPRRQAPPTLRIRILQICRAELRAGDGFD